MSEGFGYIGGRRYNFQTHPCPKCGAAIGKPCVSRNGNAQPWNGVHVARLRVRHLPPERVQVRYAYPRPPKAVGVIVISQVGVQVLARLVRGC